eukprot:3350926-Rhodomonas_salina.1
MNLGLPVRCVYIEDESKKQADDDIRTEDFSLCLEFYTRDQAQIGAMMLEEALQTESSPKAYEGVTVTHSLFTAEIRYDLQQLDLSIENRY